jgi:hypothetical protein
MDRVMPFSKRDRPNWSLKFKITSLKNRMNGGLLCPRGRISLQLAQWVHWRVWRRGGCVGLIAVHRWCSSAAGLLVLQQIWRDFILHTLEWYLTSGRCLIYYTIVVPRAKLFKCNKHGIHNALRISKQIYYVIGFILRKIRTKNGPFRCFYSSNLNTIFLCIL